MRRIVLPGADVSVSRFIFGTASLFNVRGERQRIALLEAAVDAGFSHFDTAPYYGFGMAERNLAQVLKRHSHVTVTTKVGIYSPGGEERPAAEIFLRKVAGRFIKKCSRPTIDFELARARNALEGSLRRLGRDHVEIYMLHAPQIELLNADEWRRWLEQQVKSGVIGAFGIAAATADSIQGFLEKDPALARVVQAPDSLDLREADVLGKFGRPLQITYGYVSSARSRGDNRPVTEILSGALRRNSTGAIIISSRRRERLGQYAQVLEENDANRGP
jgi:D-threo-aldose 1-dehydrogenase